jgi:hypothetical protein
MTDRSVPTPLRAAAGLAALAIDEARRLPGRLVTLPVVAVSTAMQASMKIQQGYTELAVRGDQLLAQLRHGPEEETPPWARFDEDEEGGGRVDRFFGGADVDLLGEETPADLLVTREELVERGVGPVPTLDETVGAVGETLPVEQYDELSIPQLRARLRRLSADEVERLVAYERATRDRAPYLTMLENRLATLRGL